MFRNKKLVNLLAEIFGFPRKYSHGIVEVEYNCPHCDKGRNKFNMVVNTDHHVFHCWACGYKGKVSKLFWEYGNEQHKQEYNNFDISITSTQHTTDDSVPIYLTGFRSLKIGWKDSLTYKAALKYLHKRNIDQYLIDKWDICYAEEGAYADRVIVPSKDLNGKIDYFIARDIFDTQKLKYKNPPTPKTNLIFGEKFIDWKNPVILTEGVFDAMVLYNSIPLIGSKISGYEKLIRKIYDNQTPIILGFDNDKAGKEATITVGKLLLNFNIPVYIITGNMYNDIANAYAKAGKEYILNLIRTAEPFDELDIEISKLL